VLTQALGRLATRTRQGLLGPLAVLWRERDLLGVLFRRDMAVRTSGTLFGGLWMFVQPALQVVAFWFLLDFVLRVRFPGAVPFLHYFLAGMIPWQMMADAMNRSVYLMGEFAPLYARAVFPLPLLPLLPPLVAGAIYGVVYTLVMLVLEGPASAALAPLVIIALMLWLMPVCYLLSLVGVFVRDLAQAIPFLITIVFYLTPILYMPEMLPERAQDWMILNPFADLMASVHGVLQGTEAGLGNVLRPLAVWLVLLGPAWVLFHRATPHIREAL